MFSSLLLRGKDKDQRIERKLRIMDRDLECQKRDEFNDSRLEIAQWVNNVV